MQALASHGSAHDGAVIAPPARRLWIEPGAHVVMSGLMAAMFLTAL